MKNKSYTYLLLAALMTVFFAGCGGGNTPAVQPQAVLFGLSTSQTNVLNDNTDSSTITAMFVSAVPDGTKVDFSIVSGSAQFVASSSVTTTGNKASVAIKSLASATGLVTVSATSGGLNASATVNIVPNIAVNTSKATVSADGSDYATITATLPTTVPDGTQVDFAVNSGTATLNSFTATTSGGKALITVKNTSLGQVVVAATLHSNSAITGNVAVDFTIQIPVTASPSTGILADGSDSSIIVADFTQANITVPNGETVSFSASGGAVLSALAATTSNGKATVTLKSSNPGTVVVTASYKGSAGSANVTFTQPSFSVSASKSIALNNNADTITIKATFQAPLPADQSVVTFSIPSGTATPSALTAKTTNGVAQITVTSATAGKVTIKADYSSSTASTDIKFITQPSRMDITIALNPPITSLGALQFSLISDPGATYINGSVKAINGAGGLIAALPVGNGLNVSIISYPGFDTLATPIISLSYAISTGTLPGVQVSQIGIVANDGAIRPITPPLTPANFVVTVNYI